MAAISFSDRLCRRSAGYLDGPRAPALLALATLATLAVLPYIPVLAQPFISDDYVQIQLGRRYGPAGAWPDLLKDPLYHARATSIVLTYWTERLFGLLPLPFYATSIALHVVNTWLVFLLGSWKRIGWKLSGPAAAFFALYLGHQEAVMWYAALPELLLFLFSLAFLLCWIRWVERSSASWYAASLGCAVLALLSKEPAIVLAPVALLVVWLERKWSWKLASVLPVVAAGGLYAVSIFAARQSHLHFNDGTFSLHAPFWNTWANSLRRMLWIWGFVSLAALTAWRAWPQWRRPLGIAGVWTAITLLPFCFLTYMPHIPSRHTYLPSAGLAFLVGAGFLAFGRRYGARARWAVPTLAAVIAAHQCGYIWIRKRQQFLERAEPTQALLRMAADTTGPIYVHCFPYGREIARLALDLTFEERAPLLVWTTTPPADADPVYCANPEAHAPKALRAAFEGPGAGGRP